MLQISQKLSKHLPSSVSTSLGKMDAEKQAVFEKEFKKEVRNPVVAFFMALLLPGWHFLYTEGSVDKMLIFWLTWGGFGVWYIIEWFVASIKANKNNEIWRTSYL